MKRFLVIFTLAAMAVGIAGPAVWASTYFVYDTWGGTWHDANKTAANTEDDLMCWAATASNVLAWGKWGTEAYNTADKIFQHFQDHWTDNSGYMSWAWKWWLDGSWPPTSYSSYPDVPGGGSFYPDLNFSDYFIYASASDGNLMATIDSLIHQGYGIGLTIGKNYPSHAVTCWGYEYDYTGDFRTYKAIYLTDSDDGVTALKKYLLTWQNDTWFLSGAYAGWHICNLQALKYHTAYNPINPTWLLMGTGLIILALQRLRKNIN